MAADYRTRIRALHRALGVPANYLARRLPLQSEARRLVSIGPAADDGTPVRLVAPAARAWKRMRAAAAESGVELLPISGFRSVSRQAWIIRRKLAAGQSIAEILRLVAAPGCSEHHTGRALDLGSPGHSGLDEDFAGTPEFKWLKRNAKDFGFYLSYPRNNRWGIDYEPWHWYWQG